MLSTGVKITGTKIPPRFKKVFGKMLKAKFTLEQAMKAQKGSGYSCTLSLTSALDGGVWPRSRPDRFTPGKRPGTHFTGGCVKLEAGLDVNGKISPPPAFDPRTIQPVASRYIDCAMYLAVNKCITARFL